jgi:hypothetical protein
MKMRTGRLLWRAAGPLLFAGCTAAPVPVGDDPVVIHVPVSPGCEFQPYQTEAIAPPSLLPASPPLRGPLVTRMSLPYI